MSLRSAAVLVGALATSVLGHGVVTDFTADGVAYKGYNMDNYYAKQNGQPTTESEAWSAENTDNGFVDGTGYATTDIICHKNSAPGAKTATVKAGGEVSFKWSAWPESHKGPVFTYVAACDGDCADADVATLKWVKIDEGGFDTKTQEFVTTQLIENDSTWVTKVPSTLAAGNYVFRHEIIAMHGADQTNGAQNYPQCFNIAITGSGTDKPEGVLGTKLYTPTDPGIKFNPYTTISDYKIPGPALYGAGSGSGSSPSPVTPPTPVNSTVAPIVSEPAEVELPVTTPIAETEEPIAAEPTAVDAEEPVAAEPTAAATTSAAPVPEYDDEEETGSGSGSGSLPQTFTLETFITWLRGNAGSGSAKARRHAREF